MDMVLLIIILLLLFGGGGGLYWGLGAGWGIGPIGLIVLVVVVCFFLFAGADDFRTLELERRGSSHAPGLTARLAFKS